MYAIKAGYQEREQPQYFPDETRITFQPDVYAEAGRIALERRATAIVDVGCGHAGKLAALHEGHGDWTFCGIDYGSNIEWCRANYGWGSWLDLDLDAPHVIDAEGGVIISADVIEHLRHPEHLLAAIRESGCAAAVLSTPERDLTWGTDHSGPPPNPCHVREWNQAEFGDLLTEAGFEIEHLGLTRTDDAGFGDKTILAAVTAPSQ